MIKLTTPIPWLAAPSIPRATERGKGGHSAPRDGQDPNYIADLGPKWN